MEFLVALVFAHLQLVAFNRVKHYHKYLTSRKTVWLYDVQVIYVNKFKAEIRSTRKVDIQEDVDIIVINGDYAFIRHTCGEQCKVCKKYFLGKHTCGSSRFTEDLSPNQGPLLPQKLKHVIQPFLRNFVHFFYVLFDLETTNAISSEMYPYMCGFSLHHTTSLETDGITPALSPEAPWFKGWDPKIAPHVRYEQGVFLLDNFHDNKNVMWWFLYCVFNLVEMIVPPGSDTQVALCFMAYNGSGFDFQPLLKEIIDRLDPDDLEMGILKNRVQNVQFTIGRYTVMTRDPMKMIPIGRGTLSSAYNAAFSQNPEMLKLGKLPDVDHNLVQLFYSNRHLNWQSLFSYFPFDEEKLHPEVFLRKYCARDVFCLYHVVDYTIKFFRTVYTSFEQFLSGSDYGNHMHWLIFPNLQSIAYYIFVLSIYRKKEFYLPSSPLAYDIRGCCHGGRVFCSTVAMVWGSVFGWDWASLYPSCFALTGYGPHEFLSRANSLRFIKLVTQSYIKIIQFRPFFIHGWFKNTNTLYRHCGPFHNLSTFTSCPDPPIASGYVFVKINCVDMFAMYLDGWRLDTSKEFFLAVMEGWTNVPQHFFELCYEIKLRGVKEKDEALRWTGKQFMNSCIGKTGQKTYNSFMTEVDEATEETVYLSNRMFNKADKAFVRERPISMMSFVLSWSKLVMISLRNILIEAGCIMLYGDTDSVTIQDNPDIDLSFLSGIVGDKLGSATFFKNCVRIFCNFKYEEKGDVFIVLGKKSYLLSGDQGTKIRAKGHNGAMLNFDAYMEALENETYTDRFSVKRSTYHCDPNSSLNLTSARLRRKLRVNVPTYYERCPNCSMYITKHILPLEDDSLFT